MAPSYTRIGQYGALAPISGEIGELLTVSNGRCGVIPSLPNLLAVAGS
jgi:hypothetical protein